MVTSVCITLSKSTPQKQRVLDGHWMDSGGHHPAADCSQLLSLFDSCDSLALLQGSRGPFSPKVATGAETVRNQVKGVLAKGGGVFCRVQCHVQDSVESSVTSKEAKNTQGYWAQQYVWHSERHSQEQRTFLQKPLLETPLSCFCKRAPGVDSKK